MKTAFLCWAAILTLLVSCTAEPTLTITFCESLDPQDQCLNEGDTFTLGREVFVRLASDQPLEAKKITGKIYKITESDTIPLGVRDFNLSPGETHITQSIPFQEFGNGALGTFSVEFVNEEDLLLANKRLIIINR